MHAGDIDRSVGDWVRMWDRLPSWRGIPCQQFPADLWRYAEVITGLDPQWVIETGTAQGGTALFLADVLAARGTGQIISIDSDPRPAGITHPRLTLLKGNATDPAVADWVTAQAAGTRGGIMVLLDDDHASDHVYAELGLWAPIADYLIVEDTLMGHLPQYSDGPHLALAKWRPGHPEFAEDPEPVPSNHPGGWLRRVAG